MEHCLAVFANPKYKWINVTDVTASEEKKPPPQKETYCMISALWSSVLDRTNCDKNYNSGCSGGHVDWKETQGNHIRVREIVYSLLWVVVQ